MQIVIKCHYANEQAPQWYTHFCIRTFRQVMHTDSMANYMKPMYCKCKQSRHKPTVTGTKVMFAPATTNEMDSLKYRYISRWIWTRHAVRLCWIDRGGTGGWVLTFEGSTGQQGSLLCDCWLLYRHSVAGRLSAAQSPQISQTTQLLSHSQNTRWIIEIVQLRTSRRDVTDTASLSLDHPRTERPPVSWHCQQTVGQTMESYTGFHGQTC